MVIKMKILVISSANMDFVMNMHAVPAAGQTVIDNGTYRYVPGGKGANSAMAFRRLGADCTFCTRLGDDANGAALKKVYDAAGIDTSKTVIDRDNATGLAAILVEADGMNRIIVYPGANHALTSDDVDRAFECQPDAVFMQLEIPSEIVIYTAGKAHALGIPAILDAGPADEKFSLEKLDGLCVFSPNETEAEIFAGKAPDSETACLEVAKILESKVRAEYYVIKLGGRGAYLLRRGETAGKLFHPFKTEVVDTTAAGDAFTAALTLEFLRTGDMERAVRYANAVGAITVSRAGASPSIPTADEVEKFLETR